MATQLAQSKIGILLSYLELGNSIQLKQNILVKIVDTGGDYVKTVEMKPGGQDHVEEKTVHTVFEHCLIYDLEFNYWVENNYDYSFNEKPKEF